MDNITEHYISIFYSKLDYLEYQDLDKDKNTALPFSILIL